jgi:small basic protein
MSVVSDCVATAVTVIVLMLGLCFLVGVCLRGTPPHQRPAILQALDEVLGGVRLTCRRDPGDRTGADRR